MRVAIIVLGVLLCSAANAEPQSWMKSDDPDTLRYMVDVDSCPISKAALDELVTGILIRSRLKPQPQSQASTSALGVSTVSRIFPPMVRRHFDPAYPCETGSHSGSREQIRSFPGSTPKLGSQIWLMGHGSI